mgnify:CR=1 FL=1
MLYLLVEYIGVSVNEYVIITTIVDKLYFEYGGCHLNKISLSFMDSVRHLVSCKKKNKQYKLFAQAFERAQQDLDIVYITKTIRKLKAALCAVIGDDSDKIDKAKEIFRD